jgi:DNA repair protein RadA/Sms
MIMAKKSKEFACTNCGHTQSSWSGKCSICGAWNTMEEQVSIDTLLNGSEGSLIEATSVSASLSEQQLRLETSMHDVDDVFGGGIVLGSVNLLAGQPGIGKSTLLLQIATAVASSSRVLYVSAEESLQQIGIRAKRLGMKAGKLKLAASTNANDIAATIAKGNYDLVIVDSIQTVTSSEVGSAAGTVSQITNSAHLLIIAAKQSNTAVLLVGHVTKEGSIAGPKILEHVVDVVLQLEGDRYGGFKILRAVKNRFGSTNEAGIFEMVESGLKPVENPSEALLAERQVSDGSIVLATLEGTRPLLVEVQALVNQTAYGYPKRAASGFDQNRLNLLIAMLEKRTKLQLADKDIYINMVGGMQIKEPAADLAVCMAIGSATKGMLLSENAVVFGEVGLSGEVRHVPETEKRLREAQKLGFTGAIGPNSRAAKTPKTLLGVADVRTALNLYLKKSN